MRRKIMGFLSIMMALLFMGCPDGAMDLPETETVITLLAIPGVVAPASGATPVTTAIGTEQYTGTISWSPADNPFAASTAYTANISLTAKEGWTLTGVAANSFTVAGATVTNGASSGTVVAVFPATSAATINHFAIPGIVAPSFGLTPVTTPIDTEQYTGTISWSPSDATFEASTVYTATIQLTAKTGWTLTGVEADSFTVAGATVTNAVSSGTVTAVFPATGNAPDEVINLLAIPGVVAPELGETPVTTAIDTEQYTGTISWSPADNPFAASTVYTANIQLIAKTGWTLSGVTADSFTVSGATATNGENSGEVTAVFPATSAATITLLAIPGVVAPVLEATPVTTAIDTTQYTGTISWSPTHNPFEASTVYTATIQLTAKTGWTLTGVAANSFTVAGATATNGENSGTVSAVFPATAAATITQLAIPGLVAPVLGATPVTTAIDTTQYTGTISWSPADNPFAASTVYTATIQLTAKTGWTLSGVATNSFTVAGATATNGANSGTVSAVFPATAAATITQLAIPGVVAPEVGATPVTTAIDTTQYTGTIAWSPADNPFKPITTYTANIELTAKPGWTLNGVAADGFTVAGATATNEEGAGVVAAVFPQTGVLDVTFIAVTQVGGTSNFADTTSLTLTFNIDPITLSENDITVTGATRGALTGTGTTRDLAISDITVANEEEVTVALADPAGFVIAGSPKMAVVYVDNAYSIGDIGPSGVGTVFYITDGGLHGMEAAPNTWNGGTSDPIERWKTGFTETPGTLTTMGTGYDNTYSYMTTTAHPIAEMCRAYSGGGKDDWFLPSKDELNLMYQERVTIGGFYNGGYWSSSEVDLTDAWWQDFSGGGNGEQVAVGKKSYNWVRPIRNF